jgi:hypothetical protein
MRDYQYPCKDRIDRAGRVLDAAGKLVKQPARPDLKKTDGVDPDRKPEFKIHSPGPR